MMEKVVNLKHNYKSENPEPSLGAPLAILRPTLDVLVLTGLLLVMLDGMLVGVNFESILAIVLIIAINLLGIVFVVRKLRQRLAFYSTGFVWLRGKRCTILLWKDVESIHCHCSTYISIDTLTSIRFETWENGAVTLYAKWKPVMQFKQLISLILLAYENGSLKDLEIGLKQQSIDIEQSNAGVASPESKGKIRLLGLKKILYGSLGAALNRLTENVSVDGTVGLPNEQKWRCSCNG